jgi:hypothetical protein
MPMQNPIACFRPLALGSSILDELASQIMLELPSQNAWEQEKTQNSK